MTDDDVRTVAARAAMLFTMELAMDIHRREIVRHYPIPFVPAELELGRLEYYARCIAGATLDEIECVRSGIDPFPPEGVPPLIH